MEKDKYDFKFKYLCNRKRGFILLRALITMIITLLMSIICTNAIQVISNYKIDRYLIQDEIATQQLIRIISSSSNINNNHNYISFDYNHNIWTLENINNNLILKPGTQIFYIDVDYVYFNTEGNSLFIIYTRNNKEYKRVIGHV